MRALIYLLSVSAAVVALLTFDDMDTGLPLVNAIVWVVLILAGLLLILRAQMRRARRASRARAPRPRARQQHDLLEDRSRLVKLPRR